MIMVVRYRFSVAIASSYIRGAAAAPGLSAPTLGGLAACGDVMSNVESVTTTTTNTIVDSANAAVSRGRWSNLAIIAFSSFLFVWEGGSHCSASVASGCAYQLWGNPLLLPRRSSWLRNDCTMLAELRERITQLQYLLQLSLRTAEKVQKTNFGELRKAEVQLRRILLPRTPVNSVG